jgi:hypothetical protein
MLGGLPKLADLQITHAATPPEYQSSLYSNSRNSSKNAAVHPRTTMPPLKTFSMDAMSAAEVAAGLHLLARWSYIPARHIAASCNFHIGSPLSVKGWGRGWLPTVMSSASPRPAIALADDDDVRRYVAEMDSLPSGLRSACSSTVLLGRSVTPAGFSRLLCAAQLPSKELHIGDAVASDCHAVQPYYIGWTGGLRLTPAHLQALAGQAAPGLESLHIADCSHLGDGDVGALVSAARGLRQLHLERAGALTDASLYALLACPHLRGLYLGGAVNVTVCAAGQILKLLEHLNEVWVGDFKVL